MARAQAGRRGRRSRQGGFSLLEAVVAFAIAATSLVVLYQTTGGALQRVGEAEAYTYALRIAESIMMRHPDVPAGGLSRSGEAGDGFAWRVEARPAPPALEAFPRGVSLYQLHVEVTWRSGFRDRRVGLTTLRPEAPS